MSTRKALCKAYSASASKTKLEDLLSYPPAPHPFFLPRKNPPSTERSPPEAMELVRARLSDWTPSAIDAVCFAPEASGTARHGAAGWEDGGWRSCKYRNGLQPSSDGLQPNGQRMSERLLKSVDKDESEIIWTSIDMVNDHPNSRPCDPQTWPMRIPCATHPKCSDSILKSSDRLTLRHPTELCSGPSWTWVTGSEVNWF